MKKIILLAAGLLVLTTAAQAQEASKKITPEEKAQRRAMTPEQRAQKQVDELNAELTLTDVQKTKVYEIALVKVKKTEELREKSKAQPETKEANDKEMAMAKREYRKGLIAVLTPEQQEKLKTQREKTKAKKETSPAGE